MGNRCYLLSLHFLIYILFTTPLSAQSDTTEKVFAEQPFLSSVNVITGEYSEIATDFTSAGPNPLSLTRAYTHTEKGEPDETFSWHFNHPNLLSPSEMFFSSHSKNTWSVDYSYDHSNRLKKIQSTNLGNQQIYQTLEFDYYNEGDHQICAVSSEGGNVVQYSYSKGVVSRGDNNFAINSITDAEGNQTKYFYRQHPSLRKNLIKRIEDPRGGYLETEYYDGKYNHVEGTLVTIDDPVRDFRLGRVKLQKAPVGPGGLPVTTQKFFYKKNSTEVIKANGQKTTYHYSSDRLLHTIKVYNEGSLYKVERFFWKNQQGAKRLRSHTIEDANGMILQCHTYKYDEQGSLIEEKWYGDITGENKSTIALDKKGIPSSSSSAEVAIWSYEYEYNKAPLLKKKTEPNGKVTLHQYDANQQRIATFIGDKKQIHMRQFYLYTSEGLLIETITDNGSSTEENDLNGVTKRFRTRYTLRKTKPAMGMAETIEEWGLDPKTGSENFLRKILLQYNEKAQVIQQDFFDEKGNYTHSIYESYDTLGRKCSTTEQAGQDLEWQYDSNGNTVYKQAQRKGVGTESISNTFDIANRLIKTSSIDSEGFEKIQAYEYNSMSHCTAEIDSLGNKKEYEYDQLGRLLSVSYPPIQTDEQTFAEPKVHFAYDVLGRCTKKIDANGYTTSTTYNLFGKPTHILYPDGTYESFTYTSNGTLKSKRERNGIRTHYSLDYENRVTTERRYSVSGTSVSITHYIYDAFHLIKKIDQTNNKVYLYSYDANGRPHILTLNTEEGEQSLEYEYDSLGNVYKTTERHGKELTNSSSLITEHDEKNSITNIKQEDGLGHTLFEQLLSPDQANSHLPIQKSYITNEQGNLCYQEKVTNEQGITVSKTFNGLGKTETVTKTNSFGEILYTIQLYYDLTGLCTKEVHSRGGKNSTIITRKYGPGGRIEAVTEGKGRQNQRTTQYFYNTYGQLETIVKPDQVALTHHYNDSGQLKRIFSSDNTIDYEYCYDSQGNATEISDRTTGEKTKREYNSSGQVIKEELLSGLSLSFTYDKAGRRTSYTLPDQTTIHYHYDAARLLAVTKEKAGQESYSFHYKDYNQYGNARAIELPKECGTIDFKYDQEGHCTAIDSPFWCETIKSTAKEFGKATISTWDSLGELETQVTLDHRQRISKEVGANTNEYTYDHLDNRTSQNNNAFQVDTLNRLTYDGTYYYTYDANGNLTKKTSEGESFAYSYDALNRLCKVVVNEETLLEYRYDPLGRKISTTIKELFGNELWKTIKQIKHLYMENEEIAEVSPEGKIIKHRLLGLPIGSENSVTIGIEMEEKLYAVLNDTRGNIRCLVDTETADIAEFYRYSLFGEEEIYNSAQELLEPEQALSPWRFSNKRVEEETHLVYFGKRYYSPKTGRWITLDPLGYVDGINRYCFVHNNPLNNCDRFGLFSVSNTWNKVVSILDKTSYVLMDLGSKAVDFMRAKTQYLRHIQPDLQSILEEYLGQGFLTLTGYYTHPLETGIYGQGEISEKVRVTMLNGISNIRSYYRDTLELLNSTHGGNNIHYIFRPTTGWCGDMVRAVLIKCGITSPYAKELAKTWKEMIEEVGGVNGDGVIIHYCHSLGGSDTATAISLLTPEERKMIHVSSFGSPTILSNSLGFGDVTNYVSVRDGVSLLDPYGYVSGIFGNNRNIEFIGSFFGFPFIDHSMDMATYSEMMTKLGHSFLQRHGYGMPY